MAVAYTHFMTALAVRLAEFKKVSESTITQYIQTLTQLNGGKPFKNMAWAKNYDAIAERLAKYADSTRMSYLATLISVLSLFKHLKKARAHWNDEFLKAKGVVESVPDHEKSEKQEENWLDWDDVLKKKEELALQVKPLLSLKRPLTPREFETALSHLVLSLYTEMPPRRNKDFMAAVVVKEYKPSMPDTLNYLDIKGKQFVFNVYKTARTYGQQKVSINDGLMRTIKNFLKLHPKKSDVAFALLTKSDGSPLGSVNSITRILNRVFGKNVGSSMLRHVFLTAKYGKDTDAARIDEERKSTAEAMSHSVGQQNEYIKE
jgi:hypothetical protein